MKKEERGSGRYSKRACLLRLGYYDESHRTKRRREESCMNHILPICLSRMLRTAYAASPVTVICS